MEFLVEIESSLPPEDGSGWRQRLLDQERARAEELSRDGFIKANWIIPGRKGRVTLWNVESVAQLHSLLMSIKTIEWADVKIRPLISRGEHK